MNNKIVVVFLLLSAFALTRAQNIPPETEQEFIREAEEQEIVKVTPKEAHGSLRRRRLQFQDVCCAYCSAFTGSQSFQCEYRKCCSLINGFSSLHPIRLFSMPNRLCLRSRMPERWIWNLRW